MLMKKLRVVFLVVMMFQNRMRNVAVRDNLNRAVVVLQLLGGDDV